MSATDVPCYAVHTFNHNLARSWVYTEHFAFGPTVIARDYYYQIILTNVHFLLQYHLI
jgi:hypothetical protein